MTETTEAEERAGPTEVAAPKERRGRRALRARAAGPDGEERERRLWTRVFQGLTDEQARAGQARQARQEQRGQRAVEEVLPPDEPPGVDGPEGPEPQAGPERRKAAAESEWTEHAKAPAHATRRPEEDARVAPAEPPAHERGKLRPHPTWRQPQRGRRAILPSPETLPSGPSQKPMGTPSFPARRTEQGGLTRAPPPTLERFPSPSAAGGSPPPHLRRSSWSGSSFP
jgi:hypothetical protein